MTDWKLIWNEFCDDVAKSVKKNDVERYFEKNIAKELLSACGWGKYSGLMEQYTIGFATTSGKADFALVQNKDTNPDVIIELKRPKNKKRDKYTTQLHDYMKQKECDFGILMLGTQMEVYYREHSVFELIDVIKYEHDNESAHYLIDLLTRDNFTTERVRDYCHDRLVVNKKIDYWSSSEGVERMKGMIALADEDLTEKQKELLISSLHLAITRQAGKTKEKDYIEQHFDDGDEMQEMPNGEGMVFTQELKKAGGRCMMTYYRKEKKYVINKGSDILEKSSESSCPKAMIEFREQIKADETLSRKEGKLYKLLEDIVIPQNCSTPSGASQFCWGTSRPGPDDWKDENGKSYPTKWWKE